jgi:hypothetical protein
MARNDIEILMLVAILGLLVVLGSRKERKDALAFVLGILVLVAITALAIWLHIGR